jgi:hypothetical protein
VRLRDELDAERRAPGSHQVFPDALPVRDYVEIGDLCGLFDGVGVEPDFPGLVGRNKRAEFAFRAAEYGRPDESAGLRQEERLPVSLPER